MKKKTTSHPMTRREVLGMAVQIGSVAGAGALLAGYGRSAAARAALPVSNLGPTMPPHALKAPITDGPNLNNFGMGVWTLSDWDGSFAFVDAMKHARKWVKPSNLSAVASVDAHGWPTEDAATVVYSGGRGYGPEHVNGVYKLVFNGQGTIKGIYGIAVPVSNQLYDPKTNTTTADVRFTVPIKYAVGLVITNSRRTPSSPVGSGFTNMRLYRPGYSTHGSKVFADYYVKAMQVGSTVRTMDWTATNTNMVVHWADRAKPLDFVAALAAPLYVASTGQKMGGISLGVALEHHIQLANETGRDLWINVPVIANDDFVTKMAQAILYGTDGTNPYTSPQAKPVFPPLRRGLKVYVEYANETWNFAGGFWCFYAITDIAKTLPASNPVKSVLPTTDRYAIMYRYTPYRASQISDIFRSVFGHSAMMTRVRPVLMGQKGSAISGTLPWLDAYCASLNPPREIKSFFYGAGGSAYYGAKVLSPVPDKYFVPNNYPDAATAHAFPYDAVAARNWGLQRIAYEGGNGLDVPGWSNAQILALNADPRMETMTKYMHDYWSRNGGDLLVYYTINGATPWEFTPNIMNLDSPKYNALLALRKKRRAPATLGQLLPGIFLAGKQAPMTTMATAGLYGTTVQGKPAIGGLRGSNVWVAYAAHAPKAFKAKLTIHASIFKKATLTVWINGVRQPGTITMPKTNGLEWSTPVLAEIPQGFLVVRLHLASGDVTWSSIKVEAT